MNRASRLITLVASLAVLSMQVAQAEIYKWVDENGRASYSNQKPPSVEGVEVLTIASVPEVPTQAADPDEELKRVRALAQELENARTAREQERQQARLLAAQSAYYEQLLEGQRTQPNSLSDTPLYYPYYPFSLYPPSRYHHSGSHLAIQYLNVQLPLANPSPHPGMEARKAVRLIPRFAPPASAQRTILRPQSVGMQRP